MNYPRIGRLAALALGATILASPALAISAYSTAHLNLRTGPSEAYPVIGVMENNTRADVTGCLPDFTWCHVVVAGLNGWASGEYLVEDTQGEIVTIGVNGASLGIPTVQVENVVSVGAVVGVTGGLVEAITPAPKVLTYVAQQQVAPVIVTGEIVVGAVLPEAVPLYAIPESPYQFTVVNGQNVLVDATARKVVYIVR
jgi:uncharacterized protein YraI